MAEKLKLFELIKQTARLMVGVPDYETYVRHRQTRHPGEPVMTYEEFYRNRVQARYAVGRGKIQRCC
jgi:uncharacterized short protein YbdD (DUF466 family)